MCYIKTMAALSGIFVPNIVPYDAQGRVAEDELRRIIRWLGNKGITGFYPNGSMGEFIRLSFEERKRVLKIVTEVILSRFTGEPGEFAARWSRMFPLPS